MKKPEISIRYNASREEKALRNKFFDTYKECPIPDEEKLANLGLFIKRQDMANILFKNELYKQILDVHGVIMEFGVRWGQNMALFSSFRGIYEPFNYNRKIIGFDTFKGFPRITRKDKRSDGVKAGAYSVVRNYDDYLNKVLGYHEQESPIAHIKKYEIVKGDAIVTLKRYLKENPQTIIALAYFDFDIYEPTKRCLGIIKDYLTRGSVIGFDQLNLKDFQGETVALREAFGLSRYKINHNFYSPTQTYLTIK